MLNEIGAMFLIFDESDPNIDYNSEDYIYQNSVEKYKEEVVRFHEATTFLVEKLIELDNQEVQVDDKTIGVIVYDAARLFDENDLRAYFKRLYQFLFNNSDGPRLPTFINIYGLNNFIGMIHRKLYQENLF